MGKINKLGFNKNVEAKNTKKAKCVEPKKKL
jgi:hypothetical protein